ncbi:MAG TPA: 50S ribosomal protein L25 [Malonomonas sp.]
MAQAELNVEIRENTGKGVARKLRVLGKAPAVVYGKGMKATTITVDAKALEAAIATEAGWNTLLTLKGAPEIEGKVVVLKDLDLHAIRRTIVCADFHAIDLSKKGIFMVPVVTVGESKGEKAGGTLQVIRHELEVLCLPTAVPESIEIDVTALEIGDVIHIDDVTVPAGTELPHDVNFTVITVVGHKEEVEAVEGEEIEDEEETD